MIIFISEKFSANAKGYDNLKKDLMTEICIPYNTRSTTKFEKDDDGIYRCLKKANFNLPVSYRPESIRYLGPKFGNWSLMN